MSNRTRAEKLPVAESRPAVCTKCGSKNLLVTGTRTDGKAWMPVPGALNDFYMKGVTWRYARCQNCGQHLQTREPTTASTEDYARRQAEQTQRAEMEAQRAADQARQDADLAEAVAEELDGVADDLEAALAEPDEEVTGDGHDNDEATAGSRQAAKNAKDGAGNDPSTSSGQADDESASAEGEVWIDGEPPDDGGGPISDLFP